MGSETRELIKTNLPVAASGENILTLYGQIQFLRRQAQELEDFVQQKSREALDLKQEVLGRISEEQEEFEEYRRNLQSLLAELNELNGDEKGEDDWGSWQRHQHDDGNESESLLNRKDRRRLKKLFRIIAQKCHPDKTDDESKHELFRYSRQAYEDGDLGLMEALYKQLKDGRKNLSTVLKQRAREVEQEYEVNKSRYEEFIRSNEYKALLMTQQPGGFSALVNENRNQLRKQISEANKLEIDTKRRINEALGYNKYDVPDDQNNKEPAVHVVFYNMSS